MDNDCPCSFESLTLDYVYRRGREGRGVPGIGFVLLIFTLDIYM